MFLRQRQDARDFCFSYFVSKDACDTNALMMYLKHDPDRILLGLMKDIHQDKHHKLHRRVIVIVKQDLVERRFLQLLFALGLNCAVVL